MTGRFNQGRHTPSLGWADGSQPARRACQRGQGRAPARALSGRARVQSVPDRAEPAGRRQGRARAPGARGRPRRRFDRHLRRLVRAAGALEWRAQAGCHGRPARAPPAARRGENEVRGAQPLRQVRRLRRRARGDCRRAGVRAARARRARRRAGRPLCRIPRGARTAQSLGPRAGAPLRRRADRRRARGLGRPAGLRLRVRGPDRRRVGAGGGALGPLGGDGLAAL